MNDIVATSITSKHCAALYQMEYLYTLLKIVGVESPLHKRKQLQNGSFLKNGQLYFFSHNCCNHV